jgi:hypothetical protein
MFRALVALGVLGATVGAALPAHAQYYPPPPGYYYDDGPPPPPRRYRHREYYPPPYYPPPQPYYGGSGLRGNPNDEPWRPRYDPRNGGTYCVLPGYTVQDGICKPYRGR